jgi:predicted nucleic acid-binding Zn ribbon protein
MKMCLTEKAYGILIDSLSVDPLATVQHILNDDNLDTCLKIHNVVTHFREHDGVVTPVKVAAIEKQIANIPPATEAKSAKYLIAALTNFNGLLKKYGDAYHYSNSKLQHILSQALQDPIFITVVAKFDDSPDMTWEQMSQAVMKAVDRHASTVYGNQFLTRRKRPAEDSSNSSLPPPQQACPQIVAMHRRASPTCWNGSGADHYACECPALTCESCGNCFSSRNHSLYHSFATCPWVAPSHQSQLQAQQHQPFVRSVRGRPLGRGLHDGGLGRGGTPSGGGGGAIESMRQHLKLKSMMKK